MVQNAFLMEIFDLEHLINLLNSPLPGWRARYRLRQRGPEGEAVRVAAEGEAAAGPGGADHEGAELPEI